MEARFLADAQLVLGRRAAAPAFSFRNLTTWAALGVRLFCCVLLIPVISVSPVLILLMFLEHRRRVEVLGPGLLDCTFAATLRAARPKGGPEGEA